VCKTTENTIKKVSNPKPEQELIVYDAEMEMKRRKKVTQNSIK
jgi:hypothetical protein